MQGVTLTIGVFGSILVILLHPIYALAVYIAALVWYPNYLCVSIGTIDISVGRLIITVLLFRCLYDARLRSKFVWNRLDTWVAISMVIYVVMFCITRPLLPAIENRGGFLIDTWFTYIVTRLILTDSKDLIKFIKVVALILIPLALFGVIEAVTHWQPFLPLKRFRPWKPVVIGERVEIETGMIGRWGFSRATGPFSHSILFGLCFTMFLPLIWVLRRERDQWGKLAYPFSAITVIGALSSMSSGPWVTAMAVGFLLMMERYKHWVKQGLVVLAVLCVLAEFASNRPLYHVIISHANPVGGAGWQRAKLIDCAIEDFGKWWLKGYGGQDPGWGRRTGMGHTDLNNEFIMAGVEYGILGLAALLAVYTAAVKATIRSHKLFASPQLKSWAWSIGVSIIATAIASFGVSFFGNTKMIFYLIIGIAGSLNNLQREILVNQTVSYLHLSEISNLENLQGVNV
ncbi:MAG: hypothetical protein A2167_01155 [Planctomycetes bacterium RBG_13_46_10]|nr:MAG: hypothetical protein A2167_01155 [Planctomycetes bacterium RBG_13_46_10]